MISEGDAMRQPSRLRPFSAFPQRNHHSPAACTNDKADKKNCDQGDRGKHNQSVRSCKPLQHLLGLGIGIRLGEQSDLREHNLALQVVQRQRWIFSHGEISGG